MKKLLVGFAIAWNMLTAIPIFRTHTFKEGYMGFSCVSYGIVGFILGSIIYCINLLFQNQSPQVLIKILLFGFYTLSYGALHLDGLFDSLDAIFLKAPREKVLSVLKDPHLGAFSVIFGTLFLITKLSAFAYLNHMLFFILIAASSRYSVIFSIKFFPYISHGMAENAKKELKIYHLAIASLLMIILCTFVYNLAVIFLGLSVFFSMFLGYLLTKKFGGLNGDMYGFLIEANELLMLLASIFFGKYLS
ncbi:Cobalamin synthase [Desulfurella amilsii]|uniref:Adenosylcobinamide-GDP ribazoletransferase n=1 Tax=Desulfurella amilsii TaxID=1562698 RepID=A0A1X4Y047_9BACT|nr:adenosylcobinamide-GDP ribazoletransferase [Desulfurella amilsii]OSS43169.1 Cobalamin synthase [Desulfurella amilsii]